MNNNNVLQVTWLNESIEYILKSYDIKFEVFLN